VHLPAGAVHAVGGGVLLAEIQQTSDATFRLFDWNRIDTNGRPRSLHIDQALACIDYRSGPIDPIHLRGRGRHSLVRCRYYDLDLFRTSEPAALGGDGRLHVVVVLRGRGILYGVACREPLTAGDVLLVPAACGAAWCRPEVEMELLTASLPVGQGAVCSEEVRACASVPASSTA
jgi:mannose-6-phosphate isomerase